jgi:hypothetical protein
MSRDFSKLRDKFSSLPLSKQLGSLASSLNRISLIPSDVGRCTMIEECKYFIEWTAAATEPEVAEELIDIQRQLTYFEDKLNQPETVQLLKTQAKEWSDRVLEHSGLLKEIV